MTKDFKELTDRLARGLNFEDNAVIMATAEKDSDAEYKYSSFMKGKNKPCRESVSLLMRHVIESENGDVENQLALIRYFEHTLNAKKEEITEIAKFAEVNDVRD